MTQMVGYLIKRQEGMEGERGIYYNYILASNGLFIEAESSLIKVRIPVATCEVRGLVPEEIEITPTYGSIPQRFFDLALDSFFADIEREHYVAVIADAGYRLYIPIQDTGGGSVTYETGENVILDLHSHGRIKTGFSGTDNRDETSLRFYGVVGDLGETPMVKLRVGVYGYFYPLRWSEVFDGTLHGAIDMEEEVNIDELHSVSEELIDGFLGSRRRLRWHGWFCRRGSMPDSP